MNSDSLVLDATLHPGLRAAAAETNIVQMGWISTKKSNKSFSRHLTGATQDGGGRREAEGEERGVGRVSTTSLYSHKETSETMKTERFRTSNSAPLLFRGFLVSGGLWSNQPIWVSAHLRLAN